VYVDKDVIITGTENDYVINMTLKKGWNILYLTNMANGGGEYTTKEVSGLKWYFNQSD
jgi:hypothetical protein